MMTIFRSHMILLVLLLLVLLLLVLLLWVLMLLVLLLLLLVVLGSICGVHFFHVITSGWIHG